MGGMSDEEIDFEGMTKSQLMAFACDVIDEQRRHVADRREANDRKFWRYKFAGQAMRSTIEEARNGCCANSGEVK